MRAKIESLVLIAALFVAGTARAGAYNPAVYPGRYTSGASLVASGVIATSAALLIGCEIQNTSGSAQYYLFYDKATVPADGTGSGGFVASTNEFGWKAFIYCAAATTCSWGANGPNTNVGGSGVVFANGISWSNSSTFPLKTIGTTDSAVACSYQQ